MKFSAPPWAAETAGGDLKLVVASRNPGKIREFARLLEDYPWTLLSLDEVGFVGDIEERHDTYEGNAIDKAVTVSERTGLPAIADDSGIEVMALDGWPGPKSARWMGSEANDADRLRGLIAETRARSPGDLRARYVAVVALARPLAPPATAQGVVEGELVEPQGSNGFGYDPGFLSRELGVTFGQANAEEKDRVSHRARALKLLAATHLREATHEA